MLDSFGVSGRLKAILAMLASGGIPGTVKSIQTGVNTTTSASTGTAGSEDDRYVDITISAVVVNKSVVLVQPIRDTSDGQPLCETARLTSTTNLRLSRRGVTTENYVAARWTVIEYY
jgi:hypothetical protein